MTNVACAVILFGDRFLIAQKKFGPESGLWEFPGGKCHHNETIKECAVREVKEELNLDVKPIKVLFVNSIENDRHGLINLHFIECHCVIWGAQLTEHADVRLVDQQDLESYPFTEGDIPFVRWLLG